MITLNASLKNKTFALLLCLAAVLIISSCSAPRSGETIFREEGCSGCHSFKGRGGRIGPDLTAVTARRSDNWIFNFLPDPEKQIPGTRMPGFKNLSRAERRALISFLKQ